MNALAAGVAQQAAAGCVCVPVAGLLPFLV